MNPLEDDDISHDSEAYRRWKGGTDTPQSEYLGNAVVPHPTAGLDTALPLAFRSFFATAWCSFLIVFNIILRFGGEGAPPFLFIQIFMVPFYGVGLFLLYTVYGGTYNLFVDKDTGIIAKMLALLIGLWPPLAFYLLVNSTFFF